MQSIICLFTFYFSLISIFNTKTLVLLVVATSWAKYLLFTVLFLFSLSIFLNLKKDWTWITQDDSVWLKIGHQAKQSRTTNRNRIKNTKPISHCFDSFLIYLLLLCEREKRRKMEGDGWWVRVITNWWEWEKCGPFGFPIVSIAF